MDQSIKNLLAGVRQWVNGKLEDMSLVISSHINELYARVNSKQDALTAGDNISITTESGVTRIDVVNLPEPSPSDFDIKDLADSTGLREEWSGKQDALTEGSNVTIAEDGSGHTVISATDTTYQASDFDVKDLADSTGLREEWSGKQDALTAGANISIDSGNTISVVGMPENTSDLTNDSGFVTLEEVVEGIIDDTEASSGKTYSSSKIAELISNLNQFNIEVVNELPSAGTSHTLYFVPQAGASGSDVMDEYMWVNDAWELVGTTRIDLSQYYTVAETNALLDEKQGVLTAGANVTIDSGNTISVEIPEVNIATENTLGVIKVGSGLAVDNAGTLSLEEITVAEVLEELNAEDEEEEVGA